MGTSTHRRLLLNGSALLGVIAGWVLGTAPGFADGMAAPRAGACRALGGQVSAAAACEIARGRRGAAGAFRLAMPAVWNGNLAEVACDGWCSPEVSSVCESVSARGFACLTRDRPVAAEQAHRALLAARQLLGTYYGKPVAAAIMLGCSRGGGEALRRAAADPTDFAGVLAGAPLVDERRSYERLLWMIHTLRAPGGEGILSAADLALLHAGALAACDADDGLADGVIGDPLRCGFQPATLRCTAGHPAPCLGDAAVDAARKLYARDSQYPGDPRAGGELPGSELLWRRFIGESGVALEREVRRRLAALPHGQGAPEEAAVSYVALSRFVAAGGKLVLFQGLADPILAPRSVAEDYEALGRALGGPLRAARSVRLFLVPGMQHCGGGDGAYRIDFLHGLETWVGRGAVRPPDDLIAFHPRAGAPSTGLPFAPLALDPAHAAFSSWTVGSSVTLAQSRDQPHAVFSRPVYLYPMRTRYKGVGDPSSWRSFYSPNDYPYLAE